MAERVGLHEQAKALCPVTSYWSLSRELHKSTEPGVTPKHCHERGGRKQEKKGGKRRKERRTRTTISVSQTAFSILLI